jgi:cyclopropane-fatty-acyl-phospholipid synthase
MAVSQLTTNNAQVQECRDVFQMLLGDSQPRDYAVRFWDGTVWEPESGEPRFTVVLRHPGALRRMFWPPKRNSLFESYALGDCDIEGDFESFLVLTKHARERPRSLKEKLRLAARLYRLPKHDWPRANWKPPQIRGAFRSLERDKQAVDYHYSMSNDFFALFLDSRMVYTCAYFKTPDDDLETAQTQKLDHICRKLRLRPGDRLLEMGCGWGGLAIHAAKNYGARVLALNISKPQIDFANERVRKEGLGDRCRFELRDYRQVQEPGAFDKVVAAGLLEHVGESMTVYFKKAWDHLKPGGVFLSHGIGMNYHEPMPRRPGFIQRYVFPDGELLPISRNLRFAEQVGFEVRDVECFRDHYVLTLRHWLRVLEARADEAKRITDEVTYRIYRLYLAASAAGFRTGLLHHYQTLLVKPDRGVSGLPLTRADWYA